MEDIIELLLKLALSSYANSLVAFAALVPKCQNACFGPCERAERLLGLFWTQISTTDMVSSETSLIIE